MKLTLVRIWVHLCSGDIGAGSAFLREDGEDGAEPAVAMREMGAGASKEVNCVFMSRTRELVDLCTREGIEVEEEDGGTLTVGECLDHQEDVEVGGEVAEAAQESSHVHGEQLGWGDR